MSIKSQARADYEIPLGRVKPCFTTFFTPSKAWDSGLYSRGDAGLPPVETQPQFGTLNGERRKISGGLAQLVERLVRNEKRQLF